MASGAKAGMAILVSASCAWMAAPARADVVDAGSLVAEERGTAVELRQPGHPESTLELVSTDPATAERSVERAGEGLVRIRIRASGGTPRVSASFARVSSERFLGFGERSDAVVRDAGTVEHRVSEGPYQDIEQPFLAAFVPPPGYNPRHDATYYPIPWLISTRGYGVLVENDATSRHRLEDPWSVQVDDSELTLLVVAGPRPRDVVRRFSAHVGRQPAVLPEALGPWWQPRSGSDHEEVLRELGAARALGSIVQTFTHYLPCADHLDRREEERAQVRRFERKGLTVLTYFNPMICTRHPRYAEARENGWLTKTPLGTPAEYRYTAASTFLVGQIDFRAAGAQEFFTSLLDEALVDGHKGWMEDFGEYTPDDSVAADGSTGSAHHNAYPRDYHAAAQAASGDRRLVRYVRSGWTGSAQHSPVVWGGDPTVGWGFDGLASAVKNGLSMGLSGVSRWGSDIGGFFALSESQTSPELFRRWIQIGFASGVMRTQANGFDLGSSVSGRRAEITDPEVLPTWARYARLRTRLLPELERAERAYDRGGLPLMRHLALAFPDDPRAVGREDQWLLGADLLVAPVLAPGETERRVYLPAGRWVDLWRSANPSLRALRRPRMLRGGREIDLPAPAEELPLLVRQGARLELLPRGGPTWRKAVAVGEARRNILAFGGRTVRLAGERRRRYDVQWALPRKPASLRLGSKPRRFTFRRGVLRTTVRAKRAKLRASYHAPAASRSAASGYSTDASSS
jgi:alpha-glucosidase